MDPFNGLYFGGDDESSDDEDNWWRDDERFEGYSRHEIEQDVTFLRPEYNQDTNEFDCETKDVGWCLSNGFEEVEDDVWSGPWYWRHRGGEKARQERLTLNRERREQAKHKREQQKSSSIRRIDDETFAEILAVKQHGNDAFRKGNYQLALSFYSETNELDPIFALGCFLADEQKEEKVKILSNQAECHLRLKQYQQAQMSANEALALDKRHEKSLIRRAKATYYGNVGNKMNPLAAGMAQEDLEKVIRMGAGGAGDAEKLLAEINLEMEKELRKIRSDSRETWKP